jgi:hypothetical protein
MDGGDASSRSRNVVGTKSIGSTDTTSYSNRNRHAFSLAPIDVAPIYTGDLPTTADLTVDCAESAPQTAPKLKGASWCKHSHKRQAQRIMDGKERYLERFDSKEEAARKHDASVDNGGSSSGKGCNEREGCALIEKGEK